MTQGIPKQGIELVGGFMYLIVWLFAMQLEVLIRRNFGERYFSVMAPFGIGIFLFMLIIFATIVSGVSGFFQRAVLAPESDAGGGPWILWLWFLLFVGVSIHHHLMTMVRKRQGDFDVHSQHPGDSYEFWFYINDVVNRIREIRILERISSNERLTGLWHKFPYHPLIGLPEITYATIHRFLEPALFFVIAFVLMRFSPFFGVYIFWCSVALLAKAAWDQHAANQQVLDTIDRRIEGRILNEMIEGRLSPRQLRQRGGPRGTPYATALANSGMSEQETRDMARMRSNLSPELQQFTQPQDDRQPVEATEQSSSSDEANP